MEPQEGPDYGYSGSVQAERELLTLIHSIYPQSVRVTTPQISVLPVGLSGVS